MSGKLYWITGLAGAGKTTIAKELYVHIREKQQNVLHLDGDDLRKILNSEDADSYSSQARKNLAFTYSRLCKMLTDQGMDVICSTISMFHEVQKWNRENVRNYCEIFIKVPMNVLEKRNKKELYEKTSKKKNVVGIDLQGEEPVSPDLSLFNDGTLNPTEIALNVYKAFLSTEEK